MSHTDTFDNIDVLSDILKSMGVQGSVYFCDQLTAPWSKEFRDTTSASFHVVRRGECWVTAGQRSDRLGAGDLVFIEPGRDHRLMSHLDGQPPPTGEVGTLLLCGYCSFALAPGTPLLDVFPSLVIVREEEIHSHPWLKRSLDQLSAEYLAQQPGAQLVVDRLTEIALVELVRINFGRTERAPFIRALQDKRIARVLQRLHGSPHTPWTLDRLARDVGLSRAMLARRFKQLVGQPFFEYLTMWRIQRAKEFLRDTELPVYQVANRVGYESDLAFTRTFKKYTGTTPTRYRKRSDHDPVKA